MRQRFVRRLHAGHEHAGHEPGGGAPGSGSPRYSEGHSHPAVSNLPVEERVDGATLAHLPRGAAEGRVVYFDAPSGAGGDMVVAALVDVGVPWSVVCDAVAALELPGVQLRLMRGHSGALSGVRFCVDVEGHAQPERAYAEIRALIESSRLSVNVRRGCLSVFERLARAEARVHHVALDTVHFHEVGAADSIADIVGACAALEYLGGVVRCSPLPLGRGFVTCQHGVIPLPAPATVECLVGLEIYDSRLECELVTPTAAAIFGAWAASSGWPTGVVEAIGWGRGSRLLPDRPNLLRAVVVRPGGETMAR